MSVHSKWRQRHGTMFSAALAALLAGTFGLTAIFASVQAAAAEAGDFTVPAGGTVTISGLSFSNCDLLSYGYELDLGPEVQLGTQDNGCTGSRSYVPGTTTIGPFATTETLTIYLTDSTDGTFTYLSDGGGAANHALVSGSNPATVDIMDDDEGGQSEAYRPPDATGDGNVSLTLTVNPPNFTAAPGASLTATEGSALNSVAVATISDSNHSDQSTQFGASINWGDGSPASTGLVGGSAGSFTITGSHTYAKPGTYSVSVSVSESGNPAAQSVSTTAMIAAASLTGSSVSVPAATTNVALTTPVATFVDGDAAAPLSNYTALISWGDGTPQTSGTITNGNAPGHFSVSGTHTYAAHGTTASPVSVLITSVDGASTTVTDNDVTVADAVIACTTSTCTGSLSSPPGSPTLTAQAQTTSTGTGALLLSSDPNAGLTALSCGDEFRHAPRIITEANTFTSASGSITTTETFLNKNGIPGKGLEGLLYAICFQSKNPFVSVSGRTVTLGLLPLCNPFKPGPGPCVNYILPGAGGTIVERITYPAGDPRYG